MDFGAVFDWIKSNMGGVFNGLFSSITAPFEGIFGAAKQFGGESGQKIGGFWDSIKTAISDFFGGLVGRIDPNGRLVSTTIIERITQEEGFEALTSRFQLKEDIAAGLRSIVKNGVDPLVKNGFPALDSNGHPTASYNTAIDIYNNIQTYLLGDGKTDTGKLPANLANRTVIAEQITTYLTGIPKGADLIAVAANPPATGIAAMLGNAQIKMNEKDAKLSKETIALKLDAAALSATASNGTTQPEVEVPNVPNEKPNKSRGVS